MKKKSQIITAISFLLIVLGIVVMYITHCEIPFMMDDLWYATMLSSEEPITSLGDIVSSQIWHYYNWGGRNITHGILQLTLLAGENAADILNVCMTLLLAGVICLVAQGKKEEVKLFAYLAAMSMLLGFNANWRMSMFWQAGAANYLYITSFLLIYLYCYLRELPEKEMAERKLMQKKLPGITIWMIPLGLIAGWSNENMGPAVWLVSLLVIYFYHKENKSIKLWMILGNISCLLGSIVMILAPGNFVRSAQVQENQYGPLWRCFIRCASESKALLEYLFPTVLLLLCMIFICRGIMGISIGRRNVLLLLGALLSWGAMLLSPHYPDRATFGTMVLLICVIISLACKIVRKRSDLGIWFWGISVLIWLRGMYFLGDYLAVIWGWLK